MRATVVFPAFLLIFPICRNDASAETAPRQQEWIDVTETNTPASAHSPTTYPSSRETARETRRRERAERQRRAKIEKLMAIMKIEGPNFSTQRYNQYNSKRIAGITLTALGGASLITSLLLAWAALLNALEWDTEEDEQYHRADHLRVSSLFVLGAGVAGLGSGIPLLVIGQRGVNRQKYLRKKDEILTPRPSTIDLGVLANPQYGIWGISLGYCF